MTGELVLLHELESADAACSAALDELDALLRETASLRERTDAVASLLAAGPGDVARLGAAAQEAADETRRRAGSLREAESELAAAEARGDEERLATARRFHVRARDALAVAERRAAGLVAERDELRRRLEAAEREPPELEARAGSIAAELRGRPGISSDAAHEPPPGLAGVADWARTTRAALLVARNAVATERDLVIRQANELGSMLLGESLIATSAAVIVRRVEGEVSTGL